MEWIFGLKDITKAIMLEITGKVIDKYDLPVFINKDGLKRSYLFQKN
ncbi:MAG: hypothetical protein ACJAUD_001853 [Crocinitomicaceae bacterium]|jgi:hypothetical protein